MQRNNGNMYIAVFRKRLDPLAPKAPANDLAATLANAMAGRRAAQSSAFLMHTHTHSHKSPAPQPRRGRSLEVALPAHARLPRGRLSALLLGHLPAGLGAAGCG